VQADPIPYIDELLEWVLDFENKPFSVTFGELGYESQFVFFNMGSHFVFMAAQPVLVLTWILLICCFKNSEGKRSMRVFKFAS